MSTERRIALVTGASRGIGNTIALQLAEAGFFVIGTATSEQGAEKITQSFQSSKLDGVGKALNVTDRASIKALHAEIKAEYGAPLVLVNNAGITRDNIVLRMKDDEWADVINTNLNGTFYVTHACLKDMVKARWGRIINISSVVGANGNLGQSNYAASKAGIDAMTRSLSKEVASRNVTVNAVAPGFIATDMTGALDEKQKEAILAWIPARRIGDPKEVAAVVKFLASEAASYVTGQVISPNGGMY